MVSALWKACSEGHLENVQELLKEATMVDIEIKDHTGATALIEAVKNGHTEVVRVLLEKGANPSTSFNQGRLEESTLDPSISELLKFYQSKATTNGITPTEPVYNHDVNDEHDKRYYGPSPPVAYPYYPSISTVPLPIAEGGIYYPPPPLPHGAGENNTSGGLGNLPPPEVARFIPCRYFPACRYGSSCLFAHPQTPYFQGTLPPPAQYAPPYDQMNPQPYAPNYYTAPPPSFQSPNGTTHHMPLPPPSGPHLAHARSPSEILPPAQPHFGSPNGIPPSPYGPMSPSVYSHPGPVPVPMSLSPLPPLQHQPSLPPPGPQSPSHIYPAPPPPGPPFALQDPTNQYPTSQPTNPNPGYDVNGEVKLANGQLDTYGLGTTHTPHVNGHNRRGSARRGSFGGRKPPCLFFPAGRCKNGDDCRFPHVTPDGPGSQHATYFSSRGAPRPRHVNGNNGFPTINEKMATMTVRDDSPRQNNGIEGSSRSSSDPGRPRFPQNTKGHMTNGARTEKRLPAVKQRVPNADEFPVLAGSVTPPSRSPGSNGVSPNGNGAPTAAQVLQAPPPTRKESIKESSTRGTTPDPIKPVDHNTELSGTTPDTQNYQTNKLPVSFAAVATAAEVSKEIVLSA